MSGDIVTVQTLVSRIPQFESFLTVFGCTGIHTKMKFMAQKQANACLTVTTQIHVTAQFIIGALFPYLF